MIDYLTGFCCIGFYRHWSQIIISLLLLWRDLSKLTNGVVNWEEFFSGATRVPFIVFCFFTCISLWLEKVEKVKYMV